MHCGPRGPDGIPDVVLHILAHDEAMIPSPRREGAQVLKERGSGNVTFDRVYVTPGACAKQAVLSITPPSVHLVTPILFGAYAPDNGEIQPEDWANMVAIFQGSILLIS